MHDVNVLDILMLETDAFYIMDSRGYLDIERLLTISHVGAFLLSMKRRIRNTGDKITTPLHQDFSSNGSSNT